MAARRDEQTRIETKLAALRVRAGETQAELAAMVGLSLAHYRRLERGQVDNPPLRYLVNLALALGVPLTDVLEDAWLEWLPLDQRNPQPPESLLDRN
jgi:transcriptional regulator with XRE-family HTH domain